MDYLSLIRKPIDTELQEFISLFNDSLSHTDGMLEAPQYTKPPVWHGKEVPEVLKNGNDAAIADYKRIAALVDTWHNRPDMLDKLDISESDWAKMLAFERGMC